jgi:hypothetical protein
MNDLSELELRYARIAAEGASLYGDDPGRIRAHIDARLRDWTDAERQELRRALALKASGPAPNPIAEDDSADS